MRNGQQRAKLLFALFLALALAITGTRAQAQFSDAVSRELSVFLPQFADSLFPDAISRELTVFNGPLSGSSMLFVDVISREFSVLNGPGAPGSVLFTDAISREFTVLNGSAGTPFAFSDAISRELTIFNGPGSGGATLFEDAISREISVFNGPGGDGGTLFGDAVSREFTVNNAPPEDTAPPDTRIASGPAENECRSSFPIVFAWDGTDDVTPADQLQFAFRLDGGAWSEWGAAASTSLARIPDGSHLFEVKARDLTGKEDPTPAARVYRVDTSPLLISAAAATPTQTQSLIAWATNRAATSRVEYGLTAAYSSSTTPDAQPVLARSVTLTRLAPGTTYHYRVLSTDECGNAAASPDLTFTTLPDTTEPNTAITSGDPAEEAAICRNSVTFTFTGTDDLTPTERLRYRWRLDGEAWQGPSGETSVALTDLSNGEHRFEVAAIDEADNADPTPAARNFTVDTLALTLSSARATEITTTGAAILWETNKPANSQVEYRRAADAAWQSTTVDTTPATDHRVSIAGLSPDTDYVFRALSKDACDNAAESPVLSFRTLSPPPPPMPPDLVVEDTIQAPAQVMAGVPFSLSWEDRNQGTGRTSEAWIDRIYLSADERLDIDTDELIGELAYGNGLEAGGKLPRIASVLVPFTATPGNGFLIVVTDAARNIAESDEENNIETRAIEVQAFQDTTPPESSFITGPPNNGKACATTVQFCWTADDDATPAGQLQYSYKLDGTEWSAWSANTCQTFTDLAAGLHTLLVRARDASGNVETSPAARNFFVDLTAPTLSNVAADVRDYKATITWNTSEPATSQVEYGATSAYGSIAPLDQGTVGAHQVVLTGLTPKTTYHFRVRSSDGCQEVVGDDQTFTTTDILHPNLVPTELKLVPAITAALGQVEVSWRVQNQALTDAQGPWTDRIYFSLDATLDASDILLGSVDVSTTLGELSSYGQTRTVQMPPRPKGGYYLLIQTDANKALAEGNENDNVLAKSIEFRDLSPLVAAPDQIAITLHPTVAATGTLDIGNLSTDTLTGIQAVVEGASSNITVMVNVLPSRLSPYEVRQVQYSVLAANETVLTNAPVIRFISDQSEEARVTLNLTVVPRRPELAAAPNPITAGMLRGRQTLVETEITNTGSVPAKDLHVSVPTAPWLSLVTPESLGDLAPGEKAKIALSLEPSATQVLGPYTGTIAVNGDDNASLRINFTFTCVSEGKGDLRLLAEDEYTYFADDHRLVSGAKVVLKGVTDTSVMLEGFTNHEGIFLQKGIPEGFYNLEVSAEKHGTAKLVIEIKAGQEQEVRAFLPRQLVTYTWKVEPVGTVDRYKVTLEAVFETHVPAPVLTLSPSFLDLRTVNFDVSGKAVIYYTITNHGLIALDNVTLDFEQDPEIMVQPLMGRIGKIDPLSTVVMPVTFTKAGANGVWALSASSTPLPCVSGVICQGEYDCNGTRKSQAESRYVYRECKPSEIVAGGGGSGGGAAGGGGGFAGVNGSPIFEQSEVCCSVSISGPTEACPGALVTFVAQGSPEGGSYSWRGGSPEGSANGKIYKARFEEVGLHTVEVTYICPDKNIAKAEHFIFIKAPTKEVVLTYSFHPSLENKPDVQDIFEKGAKLLKRDDDDAEFAGACHDDVCLDVTFKLEEVEWDTKNYGEEKWLNPEFGDVDILLDAPFANIKIVDTLKVKDDKKGIVKPLGRATYFDHVMIFSRKFTPVAAVHEWGHNTGVYHRDEVEPNCPQNDPAVMMSVTKHHENEINLRERYQMQLWQHIKLPKYGVKSLRLNVHHEFPVCFSAKVDD